MPIKLNGGHYYRTAEACRIAGISKNTFLRWTREGVFEDVKLRDRRGWRLFTEEELENLKVEVHRTRINNPDILAKTDLYSALP